MTRWVVSQVGAREHYAVARGLAERGELAAMLTDAWVRPTSAWARMPGGEKLADRYHSDLSSALVLSPTARNVGWELASRARRLQGWEKTIARNAWFQSFAKKQLDKLHNVVTAFFSYSYTALGLLPLCRERGWQSVVGQIDPGPIEERIVAEEHNRYSNLASTWQPAPPSYWDEWRAEMEQADYIVVNSEWSKQCLLDEGVDASKLNIIPLAYQPNRSLASRSDIVNLVGDANTGGSLTRSNTSKSPINSKRSPLDDRNRGDEAFTVLFLGQVNLRKGIARLIEAMRLLKEDREVTLTIAGPSEVSPKLWNDLANVQYVGPVRRSQVANLYRTSDVFILPTLSDGYALTQLEALSEGLPVIASKRCGDCVVDGTNGWRLPDLEPDTIANAIVHAKENPLRFDPPSAFAIEAYAKRLSALLSNSK